MPDNPQLHLADFPAFFAELWTPKGAEPWAPFPWQLDLIAQIDTERTWPGLVDLPTGSGKTSLLELAVFLLALDTQRPPAERWMPRRIVLVVDRRVVVDQAAERGAAISGALDEPIGDVCRVIATLLSSLSADGPPLVTTVLRGGITRDETWAQRPDVPAIISSTVDQVGSRLLFRGYGVSPRMRPIHAGLLGNDTLFLLDEVHLSKPFADTLAALDSYRSWRELDSGLPDRWQVVRLTATPGDQNAVSVFPPAPLDPGSHPVLRRRLTASKPASLEIVKVPKDPLKASDQFAVACAKHATGLLKEPHLRTIGVIVNRVDTARRVARILEADTSVDDVCLLTGRMRGIDRHRILTTWSSRLATGRSRDPGDPRRVVVATQSIEAGADFDLDGIVTECASLDALRQRFGRVDRDGQLAAAGTPSRSVIAIRGTDTAEGTDDAIYGLALRKTWKWLSALDHVDFGLSTFPDTSATAGLVVEPEAAPRLFPTQLDQWAQTSQRPSTTEPDIARWLHGLGVDDQLADLEIVWRADLHESLFTAALSDDLLQGVLDRVAARPPTSSESLGIPFASAKRWLRDRGPDLATTDLEGGAGAAPDEPRSTEEGNLRFLRWSGTEGSLVRLGEIRPGDTIVLPASLGGLALGNWDPESSEAVEDVASLAIAETRQRATLTLDALTLGSIVAHLGPEGFQDQGEGTNPAEPITVPDPHELDQLTTPERLERIRSLLTSLGAPAESSLLAPIIGHLRSARRPILQRFPDGFIDGRAHWSYVMWDKTPMKPGASSLAPDDGLDSTSFTGAARVTLRSHLEGVGGWSAALANSLGLPTSFVDDLRLAGELHDAGKVDPRFQLWLHGGDEIAHSAEPEVLAKSMMPDTDRQRRRRAQQSSGYPRGTRHELLSLALIQGSQAPTARANDPELTSYLVASHHGFGRYRFEPVADPDPRSVTFERGDTHLEATTDHGLLRLDQDVPALFWRLTRRYGWYHLAWLESVLRLADQQRSRLEQTGQVADATQETTP